jgi:hypothetical protein
MQDIMVAKQLILSDYSVISRAVSIDDWRVFLEKTIDICIDDEHCDDTVHLLTLNSSQNKIEILPYCFLKPPTSVTRLYREGYPLIITAIDTQFNIVSTKLNEDCQVWKVDGIPYNSDCLIYKSSNHSNEVLPLVLSQCLNILKRVSFSGEIEIVMHAHF